MRFEFATAGRIVFGPGAIRDLPGLAAGMGNNVLVVTGSHSDRAKAQLAPLEAAGFPCRYLACVGEPNVAFVREGAQAARYANLVIGFGGGSAIDAAKAIAAVAANSGEPMDYLEVVGKAQPLENPALPFIAIPTTAGTGAEVTRNAVLGSPEHGVKASIRHPSMLAKVALIDPELGYGVPPEVTAASGLDTLTQLIEPFVSSRANAFADLFCLNGLRKVPRSLPRAVANGGDAAAREEMAFASLQSGLALANAGLGVIHGLAAPLGGLLDAPHGALCAALLPYGVAANLQALRQRAPQHPSLDRYARIAALLTDDATASAESAVTALTALCRSLQTKSLSHWGLGTKDLEPIAAKAAAASSMKANPVLLSTPELCALLESAL